MNFYLIIIALILAYCINIKAEDVDNEYDEYSQDKASYHFIEPTPTLTPTITNNEPVETDASMTTTVMTYSYTYNKYNVITTTLPTDVDESFISCNENRKLTTYGCDPHMTCYRIHNQFYRMGFSNKITCGIYTHKTDDLIPTPDPTWIPAFFPCSPTTYDYTYIYSEKLYETKLYETISDEVITTTQSVYSYRSEPRVYTKCPTKSYTTFVYPQETLLPYFVKVYGLEDEYVQKNLVIPKKRGFQIKKLDGYCVGGINPAYTTTYKAPTTPPLKTISSSSSRGFIGKTLPSSSSSGFIGKTLPSSSSSGFIGNTISYSSSSGFTGKTLPTSRNSGPIPTTIITKNIKPIPKSITKEYYPKYCNSNGECFGIYSSVTFGGYYTSTCYTYTEEPSPTTKVPIQDFCQPTLSISTRYYEHIKRVTTTIFNGDTMTVNYYYLPKSTYSTYDTYTVCKTTATPTEEVPEITTTESVIEPTPEITTEEEESEITSTGSVVETIEKMTTCDPKTITITEKEKSTITEQETVTITVYANY